MKKVWETIKKWLPWLLLVPLFLLFRKRLGPTNTSMSERIDAVNKNEIQKRVKILKKQAERTRLVRKAMRRDLKRNGAKWGK